jgi:hypothetical protein
MVVAMFEPLDVKPVTSKAVPDTGVWDESGALDRPQFSRPQRVDIGLAGKRIDRLLEWYGDADGAVSAAVVTVDPNEFINATTVDKGEWISKEVLPLDPYELERNSQTPHVFVENGKIVAHEGRHRLKAMANEGYERVPVAVIAKDKRSLELSNGQSFDGQSYATGKGDPLRIYNPVGLSRQNRETLEQQYGEGASARGIAFSRRQATQHNWSNPLNATAFEQLTERNLTFWSRFKQGFRKQFAPGGLLPQQVFDRKIARDGKMNAEEMQIVHNVGLFDHAVRKAYGKSYPDLADRDQQMIDEALRGQPAVNLHPDVAAAVQQMRQHTDALSMRYAQILWGHMQALQQNGQGTAAAAKADLLSTIINNITSYLNRSYQAFDDPDWYQKVPPEVYDTALTYLTQRYQDRKSVV